MKNIFYPAVFHPEEVGFSVTIPDIAGCFTQGDTMDEAVEMAQDAISLMLEDAKEYPEPSAPSAIRTEDGDFVAMIPFNWVDYKRRNDSRSVKKTLTIPSWLNEAAEAAHINFSGVLQDALVVKLNIQ